MPGDGELRLEVEERGLCALIALLLVRGAPTTVSLRDERRDGTGGGEQEIGECLRLAPAMAPHCADDVATQGDRLLPDFEITYSGRHWREDVASFGRGFDRLLAMRPQEIQVGILKRLRGTPIVRHDAEWGMIYAALAPYEVLQIGRAHV